MKAKTLFAVIGLTVVAVFASAVALAASKGEIDASVSTALNKWHAINPNHGELEGKAAGMLVFPRITKGGVGVAGEYGEGVLIVNHQTVAYESLSRSEEHTSELQSPCNLV